jgi:antitoxin-like ribbon-helix-helix protein
MAQRKPSKARPSRSAHRPQARERATRRKLIAFEPEVFEALTVLARDRMQDFQELADEAFADLLKKHGRPTNLKEALRASAKARG